MNFSRRAIRGRQDRGVAIAAFLLNLVVIAMDGVLNGIMFGIIWNGILRYHIAGATSIPLADCFAIGLCISVLMSARRDRSKS